MLNIAPQRIEAHLTHEQPTVMNYSPKAVIKSQETSEPQITRSFTRINTKEAHSIQEVSFECKSSSKQSNKTLKQDFSEIIKNIPVLQLEKVQRLITQEANSAKHFKMMETPKDGELESFHR
jgi:hypothetical protein